MSDFFRPGQELSSERTALGTTPLVCTIGYGKRPIGDFLKILRQNAIRYLVDIRSSPFSRFNPEFTQEPLRGHLSQGDIKYVFMGDALGGRPNEPSCYVDGHVDYELCRGLPTYRSGIGRVRAAWDKGLRLALMCSELRPEECHRTKLVGESLYRDGIPVQHLNADGQLVQHAEVVALLLEGQQDFFETVRSLRRSRRIYRQTPVPPEDHA